MNELIAPELSQLPALPVEEVKQTVDKVGGYIGMLVGAKKATTDQNTINEIDDQIRKYSAFKLRCQMELGERTAKMEKANKWKTSNPNSRDLTKAEHLSALGISSQRASEYEQLVKPENRPIVEHYLEKAETNQEVPTMAGALKEIKASEICGNYVGEDGDIIDAYGNTIDKLPEKKPHVTNNSKDDEWYTPEKYIEAARTVMGTIDLDPASNEFANEFVKAGKYFDESTNGLEQEWFGNIWLNPPYSTALIPKFANKITSSRFNQAIVLVNNATETAWFRKMVDKASAIVFTTGRIKFRKRDGTHGTPLQGPAIMYFGTKPYMFLNVFKQFGWGCVL